MSSPDTDCNPPHNASQPDDRNPAPAETADAQGAAPAGARRGPWVRWCVGGAVVIGGVVVCTLLAPDAAKSLIGSRMGGAGLKDVNLTVDSAGPFFAKVKDVSFSAANGAVKVSGMSAMADYSPATVFAGKAADDAIIDSAKVDIDLKALASASGSGGLSVARLPFVLPAAMDSIPARGLLVRGAEVNVISGGEKRTMKVDALARMLSKEGRSATVSATGDNGDQILVTLQPGKNGEAINAEGSLDPLGWYLALAGAAGKSLPQELGLEAAPLVVQFAADIEGGKPGKWVWVVSQPWLQINNGPVVFNSQDARAGFTGSGAKLVKGSAEADLLLKAGNLTVGPFHTSARVSEGGVMEVGAEHVPVRGSDCAMTLDYCRLATPAPDEEGDLSLKGVVKPSWLPVDLSTVLTFSGNLDGLFINMSLPRTALKDVTLPDGWLPYYMNGMKVSGGVDADLYVSVGGLAAGGFAASGRISSDNASFVVPVKEGDGVAFSGVRVRNARFSTSSKGFSVDIPDGFMASHVKFGDLAIDDFQLWPGRVSIPGDASLDSATAHVFGGRLVVAGMRGQFTPTGVFVPSSPFEVKLTGADLGKLADYAGGFRMSGTVDASARVSPVVDSNGHLRMGIKSTVESAAFSVELPGLFSMAAKDLDAGFEFDNVSGKEGTRARVEFTSPMQVNSFSFGGIAYTGRAYVGGWAEITAADMVAAFMKGPFFAAMANLPVRLEGGDLVLMPEGARVTGARGKLGVKLGGEMPAVVSDDEVTAESLSVGSLKLSKVATAFRLTPGGLELSQLSGEFCGGTLSVADFAKDGDGYTFSVLLESVSARELAMLFPQFKGKVAGAVDGRVSFHLAGGRLEIRQGEVHLRAASAGRFSADEAGVILSRMGPMDEVTRARAAVTATDMLVKTFSMEIVGGEKPVAVHIAGDAAGGNGVPVDVTVPLGGEVAQALGAVLGVPDVTLTGPVAK